MNKTQMINIWHFSLHLLVFLRVLPAFLELFSSSMFTDLALKLIVSYFSSGHMINERKDIGPLQHVLPYNCHRISVSITSTK